jgi:hypothetical protein
MEFVDGCNLCDLTNVFPTMKESVIARVARDVCHTLTQTLALASEYMLAIASAQPFNHF